MQKCMRTLRSHIQEMHRTRLWQNRANPIPVSGTTYTRKISTYSCTNCYRMSFLCSANMRFLSWQPEDWCRFFVRLWHAVTSIISESTLILIQDLVAVCLVISPDAVYRFLVIYFSWHRWLRTIRLDRHSSLTCWTAEITRSETHTEHKNQTSIASPALLGRVIAMN